MAALQTRRRYLEAPWFNAYEWGRAVSIDLACEVAFAEGVRIEACHAGRAVSIDLACERDAITHVVAHSGNGDTARCSLRKILEEAAQIIVAGDVGGALGILEEALIQVAVAHQVRVTEAQVPG
jgi:hypothetical protein